MPGSSRPASTLRLRDTRLPQISTRAASVTRQGAQRVGHARSRAGNATGRLDDRLDRPRVVLSRLSHRPQGGCERQQWPQEFAGVLACFMPTTRCSLAIGPRPQMLGQHDPRRDCARRPATAPNRGAASLRAAPQALQPCRPFRGGDASDVHRQPDAAQRGNRDAGVVELECARQRHAGKGSSPRRHDRRPVIPANRGRAATPVPRRVRPPPAIPPSTSDRLRTDRHRHAGFHDAGLLRGDQRQRLAQQFAMIQRDRGDRAGGRIVDHVGRIAAAAQADFQHAQIGGVRANRWNATAVITSNTVIGAPAFTCSTCSSAAASASSAHQLAGDPDPLVEPHEMRRGIDMHALTRRLGHGSQEGAGAALCRWFRPHESTGGSRRSG